MLLHQLFYLPQTLYSFAEYKPYEEMEGSLDTVDVVRLSFQQLWSDSPFVDYVDGVPKWLFPPW